MRGWRTRPDDANLRPDEPAGSASTPAVRLLGRTDECALLDSLLAEVRRGQSRTLVLSSTAPNSP